jgi:hypothetical protein
MKHTTNKNETQTPNIHSENETYNKIYFLKMKHITNNIRSENETYTKYTF